MSKILKQYRFYGENHERNIPKSITIENLKSGSVFILQDNESAPIVSLGIQTIPGIQFYLNEAVDPIIIGNSGIYELELNRYEVNKINFKEETLKQLINNSSNTAYLIVDVIYEVEDN